MERALPSLKWKTTASAACIPRRDSTSPYSMAATVFPTASRTVCSLSSGLGGPIILGCSPLLACWLSIRAPSASCGLPLPSDTAHLTLAWARLSHPGAVKLVTIYLWPPNLITGASPRPSRQVLRPADNDARLPTAGFAPLLLCLLDKDDLVGCGLVWVVRTAAPTSATTTQIPYRRRLLFMIPPSLPEAYETHDSGKSNRKRRPARTG